MPLRTSAFDAEPEAPTEPTPKPKARRTKAELIADAVIPAPDEKVQIKDKASGAKIERAWTEAVDAVNEGKATFVKSEHKYALLKAEQQIKESQDLAAAYGDTGEDPANPERNPDEHLQRDADGWSQISQDDADGLEGRWVQLQDDLDEVSASDTEKISTLSEEAEVVRRQLIDAGYEDVASDDAYNRRLFMEGDDSKIPRVGTDKFAGEAPTPETKSATITDLPEEAEVGDEVRIGSDTFRIGHGGVLTTSPVGHPDGSPIQPQNRWQRELGAGSNGPWERTVITHAPAAERVERQEKTTSQVEPIGEVTKLSTGGWRVSAGYLEKIGLPEYSSLQVGPVMVSRDVMVVDETDRIYVTREDGTVISAPRAVIEAQQGCFQASEISMRFERGAMLTFLEAARSKSA